MTLQQIEYLLALDTHRQFAKAAAACNVTQPTLSTMILRLEEELGVTLFDRSLQCPTKIGEKVIAQARQILFESMQVKEIVEEERSSLKGVFTLAVLPTIAPFLIPLVLPKWKNAFKDLDLRIIEMQTSNCLDQLADRTIDMAIIASAPEGVGMHYTPLYYEEFLGYVSRNEKIAASSVIRTNEIDPNTLYLLDEGHCFRDQLVNFCQLRLKRKNKITHTEGSLLTFMNIIEAGQGITFIPKLAERYLSDSQRTLVRPFAIPKPVRGIYLATREDFVRKSIAKIFEETIRESVPKEMLHLAKDQSLAK